jgi:hypothetical protein
VPLLPLVIVIQPALLAATQAHPLVVVTAVVEELPAAATLCDAGETAKLQMTMAASCVTVNVCPATVKEPDRGLADVFAAMSNVTAPLPVPLLPAVMVIQFALLVAVHAQPLDVVTVVEDDEPAAATLLADAGEIE